MQAVRQIERSWQLPQNQPSLQASCSLRMFHHGDLAAVRHQTDGAAAVSLIRSGWSGSRAALNVFTAALA